MGISMRPRGRELELMHGWQATFPAATPQDGYQPVRCYNIGLADDEPLENDPLLGKTGNNFRDPDDPAPGLLRGSGPLAVPLCLNQLGLWLTAMLGEPQTTGAGPYTHVFTSGQEALTPMTLEAKKASNLVHQHVGVAINSARFRVAQEPGFRQVELDTLYQKTNDFTATQVGTPNAALALNRVAASRGIIRVDSVVAGSVSSLDATYGNSLVPRVDANDTELVDGYDFDAEAESSLSMAVRLTDNTFASMQGDGVNHTIEIEYSGPTAGEKLLLSWAAVRFARGPGVPVSGPAGIELTLDGRGQQTVAAPMLTATLINPVSSYAIS